MSSHHISDKAAKVLKSHQCRVCGDHIEKGETCHIYHGVEDGEGFYTSYFHPECWDLTRDWDDVDWETMKPGDISRNEV